MTTTSVTSVRSKRRIDGFIIFYMLYAVGCLVLSVPATYHFVAPFHSNGGLIGTTLAVITMLFFEIGAIGCKVAAHKTGDKFLSWMPIGLLAVTTVANTGYGYTMFMSQPASALPMLLAFVQQYWVASAAASLVISAVFPWMIWKFLDKALKHYDEINGMAEDEFERLATMVVSRVAPELVGMGLQIGQVNERIDHLLYAPPLARQASYPTPVQVIAARQDEDAFYGRTPGQAKQDTNQNTNQDAGCVLPLNQNTQDTSDILPGRQDIAGQDTGQDTGQYKARLSASDEQIRTLLRQGKPQRQVRAELQDAGFMADKNRIGRLAKEVRGV